MSQHNLDSTTAICQSLADPTRVRLLALLENEELTVTELTRITDMAQSRISTHLAKLREAGLVRDRRAGVSAFYTFNDNNTYPAVQQLWLTLRDNLQDPLLEQDQQRLETLLAARSGSWVDSVAGEMWRHYSPGRTFDATARGLLSLLQLGDVVDIASGDGTVAELIAPRARSLTCVDINQKVINTAKQRQTPDSQTDFVLGDMHQLPLDDAQFDCALLLHALTYSEHPGQAFAEAARILRPGGQCVVVTLQTHAHENQVQPYNHVNLGFSMNHLTTLAETAGLTVQSCAVTHRERTAPNFATITLLASK